jgi:hypothetical protein
MQVLGWGSGMGNIMKSSEFNTASHIVAHQLREIEGFLLQTLIVIPDEKPSSIDLSNLKTDLNEILGLIPDNTEELPDIAIDAILIKVEKSLKDKLKLISKRKMNSSKREKVLSILKSLQIHESEPVLKAWLVHAQ